MTSAVLSRGKTRLTGTEFVDDLLKRIDLEVKTLQVDRVDHPEDESYTVKIDLLQDQVHFIEGHRQGLVLISDLFWTTVTEIDPLAKLTPIWNPPDRRWNLHFKTSEEVIRERPCDGLMETRQVDPELLDVVFVHYEKH